MRLPRHPASPDPTDPAAVKAFLTSRRRPTAVDLFCGAGGLSLGLERAGFDVVLGADSDQWATRTHEANVPGLTWCGDLADPSSLLGALRSWGIERVDLVAGGVPCQPFSRAGGSRIRELVRSGQRVAHDERADLWSSFVAVVRRLQPRAVLVENVPDLPRWDDGAVLLGLYESLRELGYNVDARVVDGFRHGVPQHRQRLFVVGIADGRKVVWPEPSAARVTLRDAIGDLPPIPRAQRAERLPYDPRRATSGFQTRMRSGLSNEEQGLVRDHVSRDVRKDDMEAFRILTEGQTYIDLPQRLRRYRSDAFTDKYKRLAWSELSRTITAHIAKDGYWYIHPDQHRTLSIREAARIQTFPDCFRFAGSQTHRYRQIGNAVPVLLAQAIGGAVLTAMQGVVDVVRTEGDGLRSDLLSWHARRGREGSSWRVQGDPWRILVAELAVTRTRQSETDRVLSAVMSLAPTPAALHELSDAEVRLRHAGIGQRAAALMLLAEALVEQHDGAVPDDEAALRDLPGVGDYIVNAVLCFAFGRRRVLIDSVTSRVASRLTGGNESRRFQLRLDLHRLAGGPGPDAAFNAALLDLGRNVCRAKNPDCEACPVAPHCASAGRVVPTSRLKIPELAA